MVKTFDLPAHSTPFHFAITTISSIFEPVKKISFIGSGNVATHLAVKLREAGHRIVDVYSRKHDNAAHLATLTGATPTDDLRALSAASDIIIIAVKDDIVEEVAGKIEAGNTIVCHTSGTIAMDVLASCCKNYGVFYPLQTFSKTKAIDLRKVPFCIEGSNPHTIETLTGLARDLSDDVRHVRSHERKIIHLAAVFACNFTNHLYAIADRLLHEAGQDIGIIRPLIEETTKKALHNIPREVQTGPAKRKDEKVLADHLKMLENKPEYAEIYRLLSHSIKSMYNE